MLHMTLRWYGRVKGPALRAFAALSFFVCFALVFSNPAPPAGDTRTPGGEFHPFGVNLWGYVRGEFGVGEASRLTASALFAAGVPVALNDLHFILRGSENHRHTDTRLEKFGISNSPRGPNFFNIIHLNADMQHILYDRLGAEFYRERYNIGVWYWELDKLPDNLLRSFWYLDEIWAVTEFMALAFRKVAPIPVVRLPCPVAQLRPSRHYGRSHFGLSNSDFVFFFNFDFASFPARKNPWAIIRAFHAAFPSPTSAILLVKSTNSQQKEVDKVAYAEMKLSTTGSRVTFVDKHLSADEIAGLFSVIDVYVSLHRSEGLGLGMLQALELGKILIATNYSGNADFTNEETAYIVPYRLVPIKEDHGPYVRGNVWAEADVVVASHWMQYVHQNQDKARAKAQYAKEFVAKFYSESATGSMMRQRLLSLWDDRKALLNYLAMKQRNFGRLPEANGVNDGVVQEDKSIRRQRILALAWSCGLTLDTVHYLQNNPDVREARVDPLVHWQASGLMESRQYKLIPEVERRFETPELCERLLTRPDQV